MWLKEKLEKNNHISRKWVEEQYGVGEEMIFREKLLPLK